MTEIDVHNVPEHCRYEAHIGDQVVGCSDYELSDGVIAFTHAQVEPAYRGRGIASQLARDSLEDVRREGGRSVRAVCPFYVWYVEEHPEYADLVTT